MKTLATILMTLTLATSAFASEETKFVRDENGLLIEVPVETTFVRVDGLPIPLEEQDKNPAEVVANLFAN